MAEEVGVRELKRRLSAYMKRVEAGEQVTVTRRGKPVAHVIPAQVPEGLARLAESGQARLGSGGPLRLPQPTALSGEGPTAADYVIEGRR